MEANYSWFLISIIYNHYNCFHFDEIVHQFSIAYFIRFHFPNMHQQVFRSLAMSLIICYIHVWSGIVIFAIFFGNVLTALYSGDNFARLETVVIKRDYFQQKSF